MKTKIPKRWYDKLVDLCAVQSYSDNEKLMFLYLHEKIHELGLTYTIDGIGNVLVTKGFAKTYPCVVSHMDTVHSFVKNYTIYFDKDDRSLFAKKGKSKAGIGGDDKCGIFACLYFLETLPAVKVVFFTKEEDGCKGARSIDKSFFKDCRYLLELDRKGAEDFIDTKWNQKTVSHEFSSEIGKLKKEYSFKSTEGITTDVVTLWSGGVNVSCVNISGGYYEPHTDDEYIKIDEIWHSIKFTEKLISTLKAKRYKSVRKQIITKVSKSTNSYSTQAWCGFCKKLKPRIIGAFIGSSFKCYLCLGKNDNYDTCPVCYKYSLVKDLYYSMELKKLACKSCVSGEKDKAVCGICKGNNYIKHGHQNINGYNFVCYRCYIDNAHQINLGELETCSACGEKKDKNTGKYYGELFTCNDCISEYEVISEAETLLYPKKNIQQDKTDICDECHQQTKLADGSFTGEMITDSRTKQGYSKFVCKKCLNAIN